LPPNPGQTNIHAVIISGLSDPAKVIASANVTLTGGLVALGKANAAGGPVSAWSHGFSALLAPPNALRRRALKNSLFS
jgi:hypothetical protein